MCWIWSNAIADDGYGRFMPHDGPGGMIRPHRYSFVFAHELVMNELPDTSCAQGGQGHQLFGINHP